jgi:hypothetical protein
MVEIDVNSDEAVVGTTDAHVEEPIIKASGQFPDNPFSRRFLAVNRHVVPVVECVGRYRQWPAECH